MGGSSLTPSMRDFDSFIRECELLDPPLRNASFTWSNMQESPVCKRLDRFLYSNEWGLLFPQGLQEALIRRTSDHWPIVMDTNPFMWGPTPFRFENMWLQHLISRRTLEIGGVGFKETDGKEGGLNPDLLSQRASRKGELEELILREEIHWRQKAKVKWVKEGDCNSKFYHKVANGRRNRKYIKELENERGLVLKNAESITEEILHYFESFTQILQESLGGQAPRPDGFTIAVFQDCWDVIKEELGGRVADSQSLLLVFGHISGLKVNLDKSSIYGINLDQAHLSRLAEMLDCKAFGWPILYLGLPLGGNPKACGFWDPVIERISSRLDGWQKAYLSFGGRITLIQSCLTHLPYGHIAVLERLLHKSFRSFPCLLVLGPTRPFSWNLNFRRNLSDSKIEDLEGLMRSLDELHLSPSVPDARFWPLSSSGLFSVKSFFLALSQSSGFPQDFPLKFVRNSQVPFKVKSFVLLVAHKKVNTNDILQVRRPYKALSPDICILCMKHGESADHLFLHCSLTIGLWHRLFQLTKMDWVPPRSISDMMSIKFKGFGTSKRGIVLWQAASIALIEGCVVRKKCEDFRG
ncbi:hypothetical protein CK203_113433 [Vitis vinifera]|uniref:Reverse transcriptase zinc-binding domain-containing protein n=1 Tax=Vitis vinifera TaxID=29760 RepID=A0A438BPE4_VITVI|nr:hypothetical protein CK203_113433 [Vitis vinifera]